MFETKYFTPTLAKNLHFNISKIFWDKGVNNLQRGYRMLYLCINNQTEGNGSCDSVMAKQMGSTYPQDELHS